MAVVSHAVGYGMAFGLSFLRDSVGMPVQVCRPGIMVVIL